MAVIDIIPTGPLTVSKIKKMVWNPDKKNVISITYHVNETNVDSTNYIPCTYLDGNSITSIKLQGSMWINNSGDINGLAKGIPPLAIGTEGKEHLEIDCNEIAAKSDDVTPSHLFLNMEGGGVSVNDNCDRAVMFKDGAIYAKNKSFNDGKWIEIVDGLNEAGNTTFGYGSYTAKEGSTILYGNSVGITSQSDINITYSGNLRINGTQYDSGWITAKWNTGFSNYNDSAANAPMYRKYGPVVDFVGLATVTNSAVLTNGGSGIIFNLPSGFRPSHDRYFICQGSGKCIFSLWIRKNGDMEIGRYRDTGSSNWPAVNPGVYLAISATFTI